MKTIFIFSGVLDSIQNTLCKFSAECGGIIACNLEGHIVDYYFDKDAGVGNISYCPTRIALNDVVNKQWYPRGMHFGGIAHSHPLEARLHPSKEDLRTAHMILNTNCLDSLVLIITQANAIKAWEIQQGNILTECMLKCV